MKENEFLVKSSAGRMWRAEVFGPGQKVKVTDIMSPTGYHEWVAPQEIGVSFLRPNSPAAAQRNT